jgi:uroporphyrin-III C-methyltransferase
MSKIFIVGAGPGRADLLTVRAARLLSQCDAVLYDRLISTEVLDLVRPGAELHYVGKNEGEQETIQPLILEKLQDCAGRLDCVVRLKSGDPLVFGRGAEEWAWLAERGFDVEVVPGVSSAISVPALAGIPPTFRGVAGGFAVLTGHRHVGSCQQWKAYAGIDTLIVLMGVKARTEIAACLIEAGRSAEEPVAFIENGSTPRERVITATLGELANGRVEAEAPAVLVIGEVVRLREQLLPLLEAVRA